MENLDELKYEICCPMCENYRCKRGTPDCEAEEWKEKKKKEIAKKYEDYKSPLH